MTDLLEDASDVIRWLDIHHYDHSRKVVERLVARVKELEQTEPAEDEVKRLARLLKTTQGGRTTFDEDAARLLAAGLTFRQAEAPRREPGCTCPNWDDPPDGTAASPLCKIHFPKEYDTTAARPDYTKRSLKPTDWSKPIGGKVPGLHTVADESWVRHVADLSSPCGPADAPRQEPAIHCGCHPHDVVYRGHDEDCPVRQSEKVGMSGMKQQPTPTIWPRPETETREEWREANFNAGTPEPDEDNRGPAPEPEAEIPEEGANPLLEALIKISNMSYTEVRPAVERYEDDGAGIVREHATSRDWDTAWKLMNIVQKVANEAIAAWQGGYRWETPEEANDNDHTFGYDYEELDIFRDGFNAAREHKPQENTEASA